MLECSLNLKYNKMKIVKIVRFLAYKSAMVFMKGH